MNPFFSRAAAVLASAAMTWATFSGVVSLADPGHADPRSAQAVAVRTPA